MRGFLFILTSFFALTSHAIVQKESEQSLDGDLQYKLNIKPEEQRQLASDEMEPAPELDQEDIGEDADRGVANELDETSDTIRFWKY